MGGHTPTPWAVRDRGQIWSVCKGFENAPITQVGPFPTRAERQENAEFIVRAVNSHQQLVEALTTAREWLRIEHGNIDPLANQLIAQIDAALTEEKQP